MACAVSLEERNTDMRIRNLLGVVAALFAATLAWGQAVPSQAGSTQSNNGNDDGNGKSNSLQVQYKSNNYQNQDALIQFALGVFPANLTASAIQKATLFLYANNGGD